MDNTEWLLLLPPKENAESRPKIKKLLKKVYSSLDNMKQNHITCKVQVVPQNINSSKETIAKFAKFAADAGSPPGYPLMISKITHSKTGAVKSISGVAVGYIACEKFLEDYWTRLAVKRNGISHEQLVDAMRRSAIADVDSDEDELGDAADTESLRRRQTEIASKRTSRKPTEGNDLIDSIQKRRQKMEQGSSRESRDSQETHESSGPREVSMPPEETPKVQLPPKKNSGKEAEEEGIENWLISIGLDTYND